MDRQVQKTEWGLLILIIVIGFALRFAYLDRDMRFDEAQTAYIFATKNIPSLVADYTAPNNHIFHTLFVHFTLNYLDTSPIFVRLPAFIVGILLIPMSYVTAKRFYSRREGLITCALVAVMPIIIDYTVNARGYIFMSFFVMWLIYLALELQQKDNTAKWLLVSLIAALGFFTIPTMLYAMGIISLWFLASIWQFNEGDKRRKLLKNFVISMILGATLTIIFYTPVIIFSGLELLINNEFVQSLPAREFYPRFSEIFAGMWRHMSWEIPLVILILLIVAALIAIVYHQHITENRLNLMPFIILWIMPILLLQRVIPFQRTWYFLVPIVCMMAAAGLIYILDRMNFEQENMTRFGILILVIGMAAYIFNTGMLAISDHPDSEEGAILLNEVMTQNDVVVMYNPSNYVVFYYSLAYDFPLATGTVTEANTDTLVEVADGGYMYIFYHTNLGDIEYNALADFIPEELANSEVIYELEHSILRRVPLLAD